MKTRTQLTVIAAILSTVTPIATAQYSGSSSRCDFGYPTDGNRAGGSGYSSAYDSTGYDLYPRTYSTQSYDVPGNNIPGNTGIVPADYRNGYDNYRGTWNDNSQDYRLNDYRYPSNSLSNGRRSDFDSDFRVPYNNYQGSDLNSRQSYPNTRQNQGRLADPFRLPEMNNPSGPYRTTPSTWNRSYDPGTSGGYDDFNRPGTEQRYRIPLNEVDYRRFDSGSQDRFQGRSRNDYPSDGFGSPLNRPYDRTNNGLDPFVPTQPPRNGDTEVEAIDKALTARYSNPVNVRSVQSMSADRALQLYREVSQQTDQRHLEPTTYDVRVRRGLRNLSLALDNRAFTQALGISADAFAADRFRANLSRIDANLQVRNYGDAENVVRTVMQEAQQVPGLTPSVVAFEFTNASIDTLDKFSALEPSDPNRGASLDNGQVRSAALESEIVGIGVELKADDRGLLIMKVLRGSPAVEAGLRAGDMIIGIDGRSIAGLNMASAVDLLKGSAGQSVRLTVSRNGSRGSDVTLARRSFRIYTVNDTRLINGTDKVAYMSLSQFGQTSAQEMDQALQQLYNSGMQSLILDLRGNPGGLLNICVDISNKFLPCGTIVSTRGRLPGDNMIETATFDRTWSMPLVVLVDHDSASASEIFAAAVQENQRGIIVGEQSYGKGTVQTHFPLQTVSGNLRLTTARFYSPNGRAMAGNGVTPDVQITDNDGPANGDRVLEEAIRIASGQQLKDMAAAAKSCRPAATPLIRNSFRTNMFDSHQRVF